MPKKPETAVELVLEDLRRFVFDVAHGRAALDYYGQMRARKLVSDLDDAMDVLFENGEK